MDFGVSPEMGVEPRQPVSRHAPQCSPQDRIVRVKDRKLRHEFFRLA